MLALIKLNNTINHTFCVINSIINSIIIWPGPLNGPYLKCTSNFGRISSKGLDRFHGKYLVKFPQFAGPWSFAEMA